VLFANPNRATHTHTSAPEHISRSEQGGSRVFEERVFGEREVPGRVLFLFVARALALLNKGHQMRSLCLAGWPALNEASRERSLPLLKRGGRIVFALSR